MADSAERKLYMPTNRSPPIPISQHLFDNSKCENVTTAKRTVRMRNACSWMTAVWIGAHPFCYNASKSLMPFSILTGSTDRPNISNAPLSVGLFCCAMTSLSSFRESKPKTPCRILEFGEGMGIARYRADQKASPSSIPISW